MHSGDWTLIVCEDNCILKCAYLGLCAFLDFENQDKDERIVIFGGQTFNSIRTEQTNEYVNNGIGEFVNQNSQKYIEELFAKEANNDLDKKE